MSYSSNIAEIINLQIAELEGIEQDKIMRAVAAAVLPEMKKRIHVEGKDSKGAQIGTYSNSYLNIRRGNFKNNLVSKGKNKGQPKKGQSGVFTDRTIKLDFNTGVFADKSGQKRPNYNRGADPKVILSLTGKMENDFSIISLPDGYGIGYLSPLNFNKSQWNEKTYKKEIFRLTEGERALAITVAEEEFNNQRLK